MKFWKNLVNSIDRLGLFVIQYLPDVVEPRLKSIDEKLSRRENYLANEEPIKEIRDLASRIANESKKRDKIVIQNIGMEPCYIGLGKRVSRESFHFVLAPDTSPSFGNGGSITLDNWHGEIYAICDKETKLSVLEF